MKNKQAVTDKDLDKTFHEKLKSFEIKPSDEVWAGINEQLNLREKRREFPVLWVAAASMASVIGFGIWLAATKEPIKLSGTASPVSASSGLDTGKVSVPRSGAVTEITTVHVPSKEIKVVQVPKSGVTSKSNTGEEKLAAKVNVAELREKEDIKSNNSIKESPARGNENLPEDKQVASIALASQPVIETEENEPQLKAGKIRSVGSLVNFVVSKVDKRKNKIIEFKEGDEGVVVSGIDLGLLKYKSKD
ncbi:hypothetical protein WG906_05315 [Pedobacter sp. P351]|uniref:hypothetical protein n=1 Tax=Pedobacter superstes TaxID=3133441 RepID=UPI0030ADB834